MKMRMIKAFAIIGISITTLCLLSACGKITVKGANGTEYESYQECCAAQDFQAAHQFLAKMKNAIPEKDDESKYDAESEFESAREEVFKQEALYLMSQGDEASKQRIIYLLKEEGENSGHIDMLIDLAINNNDDEFVKILANQYQYASEDILNKIVNYLSSEKTEENKVFLLSLLKRLKKYSLLIDYAIDVDDTQIIKDIASDLKIDDTYAIAKLAAMNNKEMSELVLGTLKYLEVSATSRVKPILYQGYSDDISKVKEKCDNYKYDVKDYNKGCLSILDIAIEQKNQYLAQRVSGYLKDNLVYVKLPDIRKEYSDGSYCFIDRLKVSSSNDDIVAARKKYQEAVRSGAFK